MTSPKILVVEDEIIISKDLQRSLTKLGYQVVGSAVSGADALEKAQSLRPDLVMMDIHIKGDMDGIDTARQMRDRLAIPVIYLTAFADFATLERAKLTEPYGYLIKPFEERELAITIEMALHKHGMEQRLQESETRFRRVVEQAADALFIHDRQGRFVDVNRQACESLGYSREELLQMTVMDIEVGLEPAQVDAIWSQMQPDTPVTLDGRHRRKDGSTFPVEVRVGLIDWEGEQVMLALVRDVTERERTQHDLRKSEAQFRTVVESLGEGLLITDLDDRVMHVNNRMQEISGYTDEEFLGRPAYELLLEPHEWPTLQQHNQQRRQGVRDQYEMRLRKKNGEFWWALINAAPFRNDAGEVVGTLGALADISELKRAENSLREINAQLEVRVAQRTAELTGTNIELQRERQRLSDTLSNLPGIAFETWFYPDAAAGRVNFVSDYLTTMLGYSVEDWLSVPHFWLSRVHPDDRDVLERKMRRALAGHDVSIGEYRMLAKDECVVWVESQVRIVRDDNGVPIGVRGVAMDTTERKRAEEELKAAKEEAEKANRAKSEFLSRTSHELRTPLNAILGFAQLLEMRDLGAVERESVSHILQGGRHLLALINEVLDIARIEQGRLSLSLEPVAVASVMRKATSLTRSLADEHNIRLDFEPALLGDTHVIADHQRLLQVFLNLLSNGIKYNREGGDVALECVTIGECARFTVRDSGHGIAPEKLDRLFVPFDRLDAEKTNVEGTGLGLALSKGLIELMGGTLSVQSRLGHGSAFSFELPLAPAVHQLQVDGGATASSTVAATHKVLYIEDNLSNLNVIEMLLNTHANVELLVAMQGSTGLQLARENRPDVILLDIHLPDIMGDEVLRCLQADTDTCDIPVVVLSADATRGQIERLLEAGARTYLTKPLDVKQFLAILDDVLQEKVS